jgi:hypothetical protein
VATSGGGGNRTRVPRYIHVGFYVHSRLISVVRGSPSDTGYHGPFEDSCLAVSVLDVTDGEPDLTTDFWASPAKARNRSYQCLGSQDEVFLGI